MCCGVFEFGCVWIVENDLYWIGYVYCVVCVGDKGLVYVIIILNWFDLVYVVYLDVEDFLKGFVNLNSIGF